MPFVVNTDALDLSLRAAIEGRNWELSIAKLTDQEAGVVHTELAIPLDPKRYYFVTQWYLYLGTDKDELEVQIVTSANADGSGAITELTPAYSLQSGAAAGIKPLIIIESQPYIVAYDEDTAKAFTIKVTGSDDRALCTAYVKGYWILK